jgi:hypothetical protein
LLYIPVISYTTDQQFIVFKAKTIFIQDYDSEGNLLETFKKISFHNNTEILDFLKLVQGKGFVDVTNDKKKQLLIVDKPPSIVNREMQDHLRLLCQGKRFKNVANDKVIVDNHQKEQIKKKAEDDPRPWMILNIINNYRIVAAYISAIRSESTWTKVDDIGMIEETSLTIKYALRNI